MNAQIYNFSDKLRDGKNGEELVRNYYLSLPDCVECLESNELDDKKGIDLIAMIQVGRLIEEETIQVKTDLQAIRTGNVFLETGIIMNDNVIPSGVMDCAANTLVVVIPQYNRLMIMKVARAKALVHHYKSRETKRTEGLHGDIWKGVGVLVPIDDFEDNCKVVHVAKEEDLWSA